MSRTAEFEQGRDTAILSLDPYYNTVPETRGISRTKSTYENGGGTGRSREDVERLATFRAQQAKGQSHE
jgi:hypothetical protein